MDYGCYGLLWVLVSAYCAIQQAQTISTTTTNSYALTPSLTSVWKAHRSAPSEQIFLPTSSFEWRHFNDLWELTSSSPLQLDKQEKWTKEQQRIWIEPVSIHLQPCFTYHCGVILVVWVSSLHQLSFLSSVCFFCIVMYPYLLFTVFVIVSIMCDLKHRNDTWGMLNIYLL